MALLDLARCDVRLNAHDFVALQALGSKVHVSTQSIRTASSIAKEMGVSHTAINKRINRLLKYGYITRVRETRPGRQNKFVYNFETNLAKTYKDRLTEYREYTKLLQSCETPNGFKGKKPMSVSNPETLNGFTKKEQKENMKENARQGGMFLGQVIPNVIKNMGRD